MIFPKMYQGFKLHAQKLFCACSQRCRSHMQWPCYWKKTSSWLILHRASKYTHISPHKPLTWSKHLTTPKWNSRGCDWHVHKISQRKAWSQVCQFIKSSVTQHQPQVSIKHAVIMRRRQGQPSAHSVLCCTLESVLSCTKHQLFTLLQSYLQDIIKHKRLQQKMFEAGFLSFETKCLWGNLWFSFSPLLQRNDFFVQQPATN